MNCFFTASAPRLSTASATCDAGNSKPSNPPTRAAVSPGNDFAWPAAIERAYQIAFSRSADADELADATAFLEEQTRLHAADGKADARRLALADYCQVLLSLNEFVFVE